MGAREHPSSAVSDRGSELRTGATVSSRMAQSRSGCGLGSAGELLFWRPIVRDTKALMGVFRGDTPGPASECSVQSYNEDSDAIHESASKKENAKMAL